MRQSLDIWLAGARPNTLPAAAAPVLAGLASAQLARPGGLGDVSWVVLVLCAVVALALQVGVNFANDYSDGIRGTDDNRVGPVRLTASGLATPGAVRRAAFTCFGMAAVAGTAIAALTGHWWLLAVGAAAILAAWFYTGGEHPYGYLGLGELMVFLFFGLVATAGTTYVLIDQVPGWTWAAAVGIGSLASALLVVNNLRDIPTDLVAGKRTLATRLGDRGTRLWYATLVAVAAACVVIFAALTTWWALIALLALAILTGPLGRLFAGASGAGLIPLLRATGMAELGMALGLVVGAFLG